jgi:hypothetical protein
MPTWEYAWININHSGGPAINVLWTGPDGERVGTVNGLPECLEVFNAAGRDGWEVVTSAAQWPTLGANQLAGVWTFKRQLA